MATANPELAARLDFARREEVRPVFLSEELRQNTTDVLVSVPYLPGVGTPGRRVLVYLLVENQSTPDPLMPLRLLVAMVEIWEWEKREQLQQGVPEGEVRLRPIVPLVFYSGKRRWHGPGRLADLMECPEALLRFIPEHASLFLDLAKTNEATLDELLDRLLTAARLEDMGL